MTVTIPPHTLTQAAADVIAALYYDDPENEDLYFRFRATADRAAEKYTDFARAIGRPSRKTTTDQIERMLPGAQWKGYRARLSKGAKNGR